MATTVHVLLLAVVAALLVPLAQALNNGAARTPPLGWLSWQRYRCNMNCTADPDNCFSERLIKKTIDAMAAGGYKEAGYECAHTHTHTHTQHTAHSAQRIHTHSTQTHCTHTQAHTHAAHRLIAHTHTHTHTRARAHRQWFTGALVRAHRYVNLDDCECLRTSACRQSADLCPGSVKVRLMTYLSAAAWQAGRLRSGTHTGTCKLTP